MTELRPNGLYDQLRKVYKRAISEGDYEAASYIKDRINEMEKDLLNKMEDHLKEKNYDENN